ncbi:lipoprotein NlpI [Roseovarius tolerans]|uniref:Lipoprotein NlpI n=1 Tax=Roseovarius tolerans TaxID=74031 RepID=A0A0L6CRL5_9RHOB|nr:tetratricopeptide repeat protein [Roseovarius tolerans]KNX40163.1 lipoprotein NlpI [Roseovarius tolerans]
MRFVIPFLSVWLAATAPQAATFSEDVLPGIGSGDLINQKFGAQGLDLMRSPRDLMLQIAQQNFEKAIEILGRELAERADYASILELAPQIRQVMTENPHILWLHALALAANQETDQAAELLELDAAADRTGDSPLPLLAQAMLALRTDGADAASDYVAQAIARAPDHAYAHNLAGIIASQQGNMDLARASFAEAVRLAPESKIFWRNLGLADFAGDRIETAADWLQKALDLDGSDCVSLIALAQVYEAWQRLGEAEDLLRRCLASDRPDTRAAVQLIRLQVAGNRFEAALETATGHAAALVDPAAVVAEIHLLRNRPDLALAALDAAAGPSRIQRAFAQAMTGDPAAALAQIQGMSASGSVGPAQALAEAALAAAQGSPVGAASREVLAADSQSRARLAWFDALSRSRAEGAGAAAETARAAADMMPGVRFEGVPEDDWAALSDGENRVRAALGMLWFLRGYDLASRDVFARLLADADIQQARYFTALADVRLGNLASARTRLAEAVFAAPSYYSAQNLLGEVALNLGYHTEALEAYRKAVAVVEDGGALMKVGLLADFLDEPAIAEDALRRFIALHPKSFIGYNQLAWVMVQRETRLDEALQLAEKADSLKPGNASILDNIGWIHHLRGDDRKALPLLREANKRSGNMNPDILYHLAVVEAKSGSVVESLALLDRFVDVAPASHVAAARAKELRARLE